MSEKNSRGSDRINFELPLVPHALRAFIQKAVQDENYLIAFVESPGMALQAAGVPIDTDCLTRSDCKRLAEVMGNLRTLVDNGKLARDFRFEEIFSTATEVAYQEQHESTQSYSSHNWDHSEDGQSSVDKTRSDGGIQDNFERKGPDPDNIFAPLINPGDLAVIAAVMQSKIQTME